MTHPEQRPSDPTVRGAARRAPDLTASEASLAAWFDGLQRPDAPASLRTAVLAGQPRRPAGRLLRAFPLGGWGLATAALLLLSVGAVAWIEATDAGAVDSAVAPTGTQSLGSLVILEDPTMPLFHEFETFDEVGLEPDEMIADWSR